MSETSQKDGPGQGGRVFGIAVAVLSVALIVGVGLAVRAALVPATANGASGGSAKPDSVDAVLNAAATYIKQNEAGKAEAILREAIAQWVEEQALYLSYGELLVMLKRPKEAYEQYEKALAIGPRHAEIEFTAGTVANMAGKTDRAVEHYSMAQAGDPRNPMIPLYLAQVQVKRDELAEAKKNLLLSGKLDPDRAIVWGTLAEISLRENKADLAIQHAARARELEPGSVMWRLIDAKAKKRLNKPEEALQVLIGLSDAEKREPGVMSTMAECFGLLRRPGDAADLYASASDSDPANVDWAVQAGLWLEKADRKDAARRYAQRAAMLGSEEARTLLARLGS